MLAAAAALRPRFGSFAAMPMMAATPSSPIMAVADACARAHAGAASFSTDLPARVTDSGRDRPSAASATSSAIHPSTSSGCRLRVSVERSW